MGRRCTAGLVCILMLASLGVAAADPGDRLRFSYDRGPGAESCPSEEALRADIEALLGTDPFDPSSERALECDVRRTAHGFEAQLRLVSWIGAVVGERSLAIEGTDCGELVRALAVTIAMVSERSDELFAGDEPEPVPEVEEDPPLAVSDPVDDGRAAAPEPAGSTIPAVSARFVPFVVAGADAAFDVAADIHFGGRLRLGGGARRGAYSAEVAIRLDDGEDTRVAAGSSVSVSSGAVVVSPCFHRSGFAACGLASLGWLAGSGHGLEMARSATLPHLSLGGRFAMTGPVTPKVEIRLALELEAAVSQTTLLVDGAPAWESPAAQFAVGLAAVTHFP